MDSTSNSSCNGDKGVDYTVWGEDWCEWAIFIEFSFVTALMNSLWQYVNLMKWIMFGGEGLSGGWVGGCHGGLMVWIGGLGKDELGMYMMKGSMCIVSTTMVCVILWAWVFVTCIGECVESRVFVGLECMNTSVAHFVVAGYAESF